jgi:hypothetical protein
MKMRHPRSRGKSLLKKATRLKPNFARSNSAHLVMNTMIPLRARDNAHGKLVVPANLAKIGQARMIDDQDGVPALTETMIPGRVMMPMDDPGMVRAHTAMTTNILPNPIGNDRAKRGTFMNTLTPTTNSMKDIINSIVSQGTRARKPRHAYGNANASLNIRTMKSMMRICTHSNATATIQIARFKRMIGESIARGRELKQCTRRPGGRGEYGLHC